jgi:hypothetical protein
MPCGLPLAEWKALTPVGSIPNLLLTPLRVHVVIRELASADTPNPNNALV